MKVKLLIFSVLMFFLCSFSAYGQTTPTFDPGEYIQANGTDLCPDIGDIAPCVADWNGDGLKDLLFGEHNIGRVRLYLNSGTNADPVFTDFSYIQADGSDIQVAYG